MRLHFGLAEKAASDAGLVEAQRLANELIDEHRRNAQRVPFAAQRVGGVLSSYDRPAA
jgi:hypothetical protein